MLSALVLGLVVLIRVEIQSRFAALLIERQSIDLPRFRAIQPDAELLRQHGIPVPGDVGNIVLCQ